MAIIQSGASATQWTIDTTSDAGRVTVYDQYGNVTTDVNSLSNVLNALNSAVTIVLGGQSTFGINVSGTSGTLTLSFEATIDNSTWFSLTATPVSGGSTVTSTSADGQWITSTSGYYAVRSRISAFTSGSMTVSVVVTPGQSKTGSQTVSGTVTANIGTTNGLALDTSVNGILVSQGSTTSGEKGPLVQGAVTTAAPTYTTGQTDPLSLTTAGALRVDGSATTQPVSGTVTANAGSGTFNVTGTGSAGTPAAGVVTIQGNASGTPVPVTGSITASNPSIGTDGSTAPTSSTQIGGSDGTNLQANKVFDLDTGGGTDYNMGVSIRLPNSGGSVAGGTNTNPIRMDPTGTTTQPVSGTITANQGTANSLGNAWPVEITDGSNVLGTNAHPLIVDAVNDTTQTGTITAQDSGSTTTAGANGQNLITGSPTAGSAATFTITTDETIKLQISGTWTGTVTAEISLDSGTTWTATDVHQAGSPYTTNNFTANLIGGLNVSGCTNFRVRATAAWTGTANVRIVVSDQTNSVYTGNPTTLRDGVTQSNLGTIKAASTAAVATDTSLVAALSPNSPVPNLATVDAGNSSTATLGSGATFTGTGTSSLGYATISVVVMPIGASAPPGTLSIEQSTDNSNWDIQDIYSVVGGTASPTGEFDVSVNLRSSFYRIVYTNGATAQTAFRLQTIRIPVYSPTGDAPTQKGTQAETFLPVQEPKDTGRTVRIFEATGIAGITTEAMVTLTPLNGFVAGTTGTSFTVTSGKTLRIQTLSFVIRETTTTSVGGYLRLRISSSGAVTTATPAVATVAADTFGAATGVIGMSGQGTMTFPDGLEISGTMQLGVSELVSSTSSTIDIQVIAFEY